MASHRDASVVVRSPRGRGRGRSLRGLAFAAVLLMGVLVPGVAGAASLQAVTASAAPDFGPNVKIIDPSMSLGDIKATLDSISDQQVPSQFGTGRYAVLFMPGTYGTAQNPLEFQIGYYTDVAGLGASPNEVTINGEANVHNQCLGPNSNDCTALVNFWRSLANLTINVPGATGCDDSAEFWATSQATSMRRVQINGFTSLMDYCSQPAFASGGFIADSKFTDSTVLNGSQQQYLVRNSDLDGWTNGVWNQVFAGVQGAPAQAFPSPPYTTLATTPVSREKPFLYVDSNGNFNVWVPDVQTDSSGLSWANGQTPGHAKPISDFFIAKPSDSVSTLNNALAHKKSLILTPGIYDFSKTMVITNPDTIVLGMGLATIVPQHGIVPVKVQNVKGVEISDVVFDAGPVNSPALLQIGNPAASGQSDPADPSVLSDVYFRIGGAHLGKATTSLVVNSDDVILDNIWAWRADHGSGVGWTSNTADTGVVVNGDDVTATGLFVEHYQKDEVVWNGQNGRVVFFQNEMPYDPPSQAAWTQPDGTLGYPAVEVGDGVKAFNAWGIGSYSFFNQGVDIHSANGFVVPTTLAPGSVQDAFTIFLSTAGFGGIDHVINGTGGSSTIANPDVVVPVLSYP